ncbi:MAG: transglycosylase domain-containing protein [Candidatus Moranbacteria bacterium]|jgi:penicillin-binding protein 1C|nr:transglycosylase domain-containing protein [Candidatus Moranbacteria bacterium]MBP9801744.1 transglycosylase domain-containing protein [Candidatus Moranbacteria bacterium]
MSVRLPSFSAIFLRVIKESSWLASLLILGILLGGSAIFWIGLPSLEHIRDLPRDRTSILFDRTGTQELYRLYGEENRIVLTHEEIPDIVRQATLAAEDRGFFNHPGVDISSLFRALMKNLQSGSIRQGGSTVTQQVARTLYLTREKTFSRKLKEVILALKIERTLSKDEILDLYLNTVPYGANTYGIETAANTYFSKSAINLTLEEAALLAVLPSAPSALSPYGDRKNELTQKKRHILITLHELGFITTEDFKKADAVDLLARIQPRQESIRAPHFVFFILDELKKTFDENTLRTAGLRITTSVDLRLQTTAEQTVVDGAKSNASRKASNASLVATDPRTGEILAMVGSKNYFDTTIDGNVNTTLRERQPGSTFKPFTYATAFSKGYEPETKIYDVPINFGPDGSGASYIPRNYDGKFHGLLTMRQALAMSLNVPAVETLVLAGIDDTINTATRLGITTLTEPRRYGLSLTLGGAEVRPLDMARAFGVFGQEGIAHEILPILSITNTQGQTIFEAVPSEGERVLDREVARKINSILSDNAARTPIFGPKSPLAFPPGVAVAAKTGTSQNFNDAWTVGYTPFIAAAVWVGNNNHTPMTVGSDGIFVAAPIWRSFINAAGFDAPETPFTTYTPSQTLNQIPVRPPGLQLTPIEKKILYIDKKTGREISLQQAQKMKKNRYQKIESDPFVVE